MTTTSANQSDTMQDMLCSLSVAVRAARCPRAGDRGSRLPHACGVAVCSDAGLRRFRLRRWRVRPRRRVRNIRKGERWGWLMFSGILRSPRASSWFLPLRDACACDIPLGQHRTLVRVLGALEIAAAIRLRKEINGEIWLILAAFSVVLGVVVTWMLLTPGRLPRARLADRLLRRGLRVMMILLATASQGGSFGRCGSITLPQRQRREVPCGG